jgi:ribosomal-protein-alanine N-acetyltransferase
VIFETTRLYVRKLQESDQEAYFDLTSNPNVRNALPRKIFTKEESDAELSNYILLEKTTNNKVWAICEKGSSEFIGGIGIKKNEVDQDEIGYQLREKYWGKGYGSEIAEGVINYGFTVLKSPILTADVDAKNTKSVKILGKFLKLEKEFFNEKDNCMDRRYSLLKEEWERNLTS